MTFAARLALLCLTALFAAQAQAHTRGMSYSWWDIGAEQTNVRARVSQLELTRLQLDPSHTPDYPERAGALIAERLQLWAGDQVCAHGAVTAHPSADGWLHARWAVRCPAGAALSVRSRLFAEVAPSHLHFARIRTSAGGTLERVMTRAEPTLDIPQQPPPAQASFPRYLVLGIEHILSGWDHLVFVLALVLLAGTLAEIAIVATGFTLAHSLTLAAAVLGLVQTRTELVEALIGFSIAMAALEGFWSRGGRGAALPAGLVAVLLALAALGASRLPASLLLGLSLFVVCYFALARRTQRPARLRVAMGFVFGLVHGFGFAAALGALQLPADQLAVGLLGFNTGVELGQLLVIVLAWPLLRLLARRPAAQRWVFDGGGALICGLGTYWFVLRSFA